MKVLIKSRALIISCLITVFAVAVLPGCSGTKIAVTRELPQELDKLSLTEMWNVVAETADLQEQGAELGYLYLRADADGNVDSLYLNFAGWNEKGRPCIYFAELGRKGKIDIREYETNSVSAAKHPLKVFEEIDKLGLASLEPGERGLVLQINFQSGDVGYSYNYLNLYQLEGGELLPLNEIVFHSNYPWCTISVFKLGPVDSDMVTDNGSVISSTVTTAPGPITPGERTSQMWFLSEDINKAEIVEYLENEPGYGDFVSGMQDVLPEGWEMELITQEGLMGHPHGLDEPLFRIDFVNRTHQFEAPGGQASFPSLRLYFYDIREKDAILETIEQEKIYSWDVPDYFDETAEYIVVTSPLYINGGCFSDEAMSLYTPLEKALKNYFDVPSGLSPLVQQMEEVPSLQIISLTSPVKPGTEASLVAQTMPGAECNMTIDYGPSGISTLPRKTADGSGRVS